MELRKNVFFNEKMNRKESNFLISNYLFLLMGKSGVDGRDVLDDGDDEDGANLSVNFGIVLASKLLLSALKVAFKSDRSASCECSGSFENASRGHSECDCDP